MVNDDEHQQDGRHPHRRTIQDVAAGGQGEVAARRLKKAANSPEKNMSSDASHTITPTWRRWGR